ncbi:NmrA-like family protein [Aspergillus nomiae NRRL 13137]|uniref:NmrA-like family protein n=1 Tax=Aspergillus nomiae NRRL (strain ATCC 15546 / NRRL 13137 / CBS 260.88 / M93) TaxID=1509407 RepID=A0A0L1JI51_ASPN3|nr:NmrA-like family protein [Aspergillus nomiae NRRL 13137]KNG91402.1 NmrA-like family protein [Aspergillus nomiae NRRL 13137]
MSPIKKILVLGAGELGTQVLLSLAQHPRVNDIVVSVLLRPSSISSTRPQKVRELSLLREHNIGIIPGDLVADSQESLAQTFRGYDTIIGCTGFVAGRGTQIKLAQAVLAAAVPRYIPWQFGVDYDIIGRGSAQDLFDEQLDVRDLLRSQSKTRWTIISTGMFISFLFEPSFGVINLRDNSICALGSWDTRVTLTAPEDIGKLTAEIILGSEPDVAFNNRPTFVAGDTVSYAELLRIVQEVTGRTFAKSVRTVEAAKADLAKESDNSLYKYQVVFAEGRGVAWDMSTTWNHESGVNVLSVMEYASQYLG